MKSLNIKKVKEIYDLLDIIRETIDPNAFIAGGAAVELYLGVDFGYDTDIDVFFKNPVFDLDFNAGNMNGAKSLLSVLNSDGYSAYTKDVEIYYYCYNIMNIAHASKKSLNKFDFIQYKSKLSKEQLLDTFDLDECKIILDIYGNKMRLHPTPEFLKAWETKEIIPHYNMFGSEEVNKLQNEKTKLRVEKWAERKKQYFNK